MGWLVTKYLITAAAVVLVSEVAKRNDCLGGPPATLPLVTVLALVWLYVERQPQVKIANHAWYTSGTWCPTLPIYAATACNRTPSAPSTFSTVS